MSRTGGPDGGRRATCGGDTNWVKKAAIARRRRDAGAAALTSIPLVEPLEPRVVLSTSLSPAAVAAGSTPPAQLVAGTQPTVTSVSPKSSTLNVPLDTFVSAEVSLPNGGID